MNASSLLNLLDRPASQNRYPFEPSQAVRSNRTVEGTDEHSEDRAEIRIHDVAEAATRTTVVPAAGDGSADSRARCSGLWPPICLVSDTHLRAPVALSTAEHAPAFKMSTGFGLHA